jgi:hypothetical protein
LSALRGAANERYVLAFGDRDVSFDEHRSAETGLLDSGFGFEEVDGEVGEAPGCSVGERVGATFLAEVMDVNIS